MALAKTIRKPNKFLTAHIDCLDFYLNKLSIEGILLSPEGFLTLLQTYGTAPGCPIAATKLLTFMIFPRLWRRWGNVYCKYKTL